MHNLHLTSLLAALPLSLAAPKQPLFANTTELPTHYGFLVFPHFQALDLFGPADVLNTLSMLYGNYTKMTLSVLSATMDPVGTAMAGSAFGESIVPTITFKDYLAKTSYGRPSTGGNETASKPCDDGQGGHAVAKRTMRIENRQSHGYDNTMSPSAPSNVSEIEVLIVPGGGGTRQPLTEEIAFVKTVYPKLKYIVSVCTGSTILSRSGILDGRNATSNKRSWSWVVTQGDKVNWIPTARWTEDGNIFTSSGISAGIDVAYAFINRVYGEEVAHYLSLSSEYNRETDMHHDPYAAIWDVPGAYSTN
ncbi:class I glutamine amidotransferase-like protein [Setomelanomma holmii]|uniref:Class I glutamine amidotransferase-like protein n=1 Tax=Setomelanomma holmii TaxID=210430 RepID=A0A9P4HM57_9PLEO|nr:class I glutamine amidotransferase-like protein [Setomelanomma holmii]